MIAKTELKIIYFSLVGDNNHKLKLLLINITSYCNHIPPNCIEFSSTIPNLRKLEDFLKISHKTS